MGRYDQPGAVPDGMLRRKGFFLGNVQPDAPQVAVLQHPAQAVQIDQISPSRVHQHGVRLHAAKPGFVQQMICLHRSRQTAQHIIRPGKVFVQRVHGDHPVKAGGTFPNRPANPDDPADHGAHPLRQGGADVPGTQNQDVAFFQRLVVKKQFPFFLLLLHGILRQPAAERQRQSQHVFRNDRAVKTGGAAENGALGEGGGLHVIIHPRPGDLHPFQVAAKLQIFGIRLAKNDIRLFQRLYVWVPVFFGIYKLQRITVARNGGEPRPIGFIKRKRNQNMFHIPFLRPSKLSGMGIPPTRL